MLEQQNRASAHGSDCQGDDVDSASRDSFPSSDPPKWSSLRLGPPVHSEPAPNAQEKEDRAAHQVPPDSAQFGARLPEHGPE